ncbi:MAG: decarboxylase [Chloroflexota bacterium]
MDVNAIATELLSALDDNRLVETITSRDPGFDEATAYRVNAELVRRRRARGESPIGRKIGFTNRTIWDEYGVYSPIWAPVYHSTVTFLAEPRAELAIGHLSQPRIEPEIVLHFKYAPPSGQDEAAILASIDWIAHGFEIVQSHMLDWKFKLADTVADFALHGALVVGPPRPVTALPDLVAGLRGFSIALSRDGQVVARGGGSLVLDSPLLALAHLITVLQGLPAFQPVQAGEIITTGTLTAAMPIQAGEMWSTELQGLRLPGMNLRFR